MDEMPVDLSVALVLIAARLGRRDTVRFEEIGAALPPRPIDGWEIEAALAFLAGGGIRVVEDEDPSPCET